MTPDTWHLKPDRWHLTLAMWHVTPDTKHVTPDAGLVVIIVSKFQVPSSNGLGANDLEEKDNLLT